MKRPRVHTGGREVALFSYAAGKADDDVKEAIFKALAARVSSREVGRLFSGSGAGNCPERNRFARKLLDWGYKRMNHRRVNER